MKKLEKDVDSSKEEKEKENDKEKEKEEHKEAEEEMAVDLHPSVYIKPPQYGDSSSPFLRSFLPHLPSNRSLLRSFPPPAFSHFFPSLRNNSFPIRPEPPVDPDADPDEAEEDLEEKLKKPKLRYQTIEVGLRLPWSIAPFIFSIFIIVEVLSYFFCSSSSASPSTSSPSSSSSPRFLIPILLLLLVVFFPPRPFESLAGSPRSPTVLLSLSEAQNPRTLTSSFAVLLLLGAPTPSLPSSSHSPLPSLPRS